MCTRIFAVSIAVTLSIAAAAQPSAQSNGLGALIQKAKEKIAKPKIVECARTDQACIDNARKAGATVNLIDPPAGPVPASGQPSRPAAQMPSSAPSGNQTAGAGFDAKEPDYASLFKLVIAANADVLGNDSGAAWEHYLLFRVPPDVAAARFSPECVDLQAKLRNELTAETMLNQARADFKQALTAQSGPKTALFKIQTKEHLGAYDSAANAFRLETINSSILVRNPVVSVSRFRGQSGPSPCAARAANPLWLQPSIWTGSAFTLDIEGNESLGEALPMDRASAETFLNAHPDKWVDLQLVVDVGPAPLKQGPGGHAIPARIVAARLLSPRDARVLHTFTVAGAGMTSTTAAGAASSPPDTAGAVLFTANRGLLLTVRDQPARVTQDVLLQATRNQVGIEQRVWRQVDTMRDPRNPAGVPANRWNPKRPVFTYEWQSVMERQPEVASGPVLDMFLRPDPDWSIVTRDPLWDTRFVALVVPTLFARDKVEGREPSFAAQELAPVYKRHLEMAASKAATKLWIPMTLPPYTYDFAAREMRFAAQMQTRGKPSTIGGADLPLLVDDGMRATVEYVLPPASRSLATYPVSGFGAVVQRSEPAPTKPGNMALLDATDAWRHAFPPGSSNRAMPTVEVLALDRRIQITSLPMEPARAEALAKRLTPNPGSRLTARVYFDAERVEIGERVFANDRSATAVLVGKVQKVEILDFDNAVIATIAAAALPPPAVATAPSAPAVPTPASSAATPRRPTAAETEAEIQRKNAANTQKVLDSLHQSLEQNVKPPTDATAEKDKNCRAQAAKVNKDPQSRPYRDAYAACQAAR